MKKFMISAGALLAMAGVAEAHVGIGLTHGFSHGFIHPVSGADHVLAMVAVGLFAAILGGRARWAVPLSFVIMMIAGGSLGVAQVPVPFVEAGIALSVLVLGALVAMETQLPVAIAAALVGVFAVFHGVAHGAEMPVDNSGVQYALGFVCSTALLHLAGLGLGVGLTRYAKLGGAVIGLAGVGFLTGWL